MSRKILHSRGQIDLLAAGVDLVGEVSDGSSGRDIANLEVALEVVAKR